MHRSRDITALDAPAPDGATVPVVRVAMEAVHGVDAPAIALQVIAPSAETAPLAVVPEGATITLRSHWRALLATTAVLSVMLHGVVVAAFMSLSTTPAQRTDMPSVEVEMVEAEAEPPPAAAAAASEAQPVETKPVETPPEPPQAMAEAEIAPPPMEDIPLPPDLTPPPVEVAAAPEPPRPPEPQVERPVVIEPPPEVPTLSAELTPPPPPPPVVQRPTPPAVQPRRETPPRPVVRRQEPREQPPRERVARPAPPRPQSPPSTASEGRGVGERATPRTSSPPPTYLAQVMAQLHRAKPASAGQTGRAVVRFSILRSGAAGTVSLASSSGSSVIDQAALAMVRRAAPFPPLPTEYGPATMPLTVPVAFR